MTAPATQANAEFQRAVARLDSCDARHGWTMCAQLSCVEVYGGSASPLFPMLQFETVRLFAEAILASSASRLESGTLDYADLALVLNGSTEALNDPRVYEIENGQERETMLYEVAKMVSRVASMQMRSQQLDLPTTAGRSIALLETLPATALDEFPKARREVAARFPAEARRALGASPRDLLLLPTVIASRLASANDRAMELVNAVALPSGSARTAAVARLLYDVAQAAPESEDVLWFSRHDLQRASGIGLGAIDAFLRLFARTADELRNIRAQPYFNLAPVGWNLSPLDRHPLVKDDTGLAADFIVPNLRFLLRGFEDVIHFSLQDELGNSYNTYRGAAQEVYLARLVRGRLPDCTALPEQPYRVGKRKWDGPDLAIVERSTRTLILVESKARRIAAETRFTMSDDVFDENLEDAYGALKRLPEKIEHLYARLPVYAEFQTQLDLTQENSPICVVVMGESVPLMTGLLRARAKADPDHPLHRFPYPYCVMAPNVFDSMIEIAAAQEISLRTLLLDFWKDAETMELNAPSSEDLRGRVPPASGRIAHEFLRDALGGS